MSEELVIRHCAPTLAGIKTGSLFASPYVSKAALLEEIRRLNQILVPKGLCVLPLRYSHRRALIYLFRPARLAHDLANAEALQLLQEAGYTKLARQDCLLELRRRLEAWQDFPHEIGLFLSYPPEDVRGFIENKGGACKCVCGWKVYGDEEQARKLFEKYQKCTDVYCRHWAAGAGLQKLAVAM